MILLDTDVCIEFLRGNKQVIARRKKAYDNVSVSFMTVGELFFGAEKSANKEHNNLLIEKFLITVDIINTDFEIMKLFGELKGNLEKQGELLSDVDILIASTAMAKCDTLVTGNAEHFKRFEHLKLENWIR